MMSQTHHIPPEQLLQYILERGRAGEHVLFDESLIRATFAPEFGLPDHGEDGLVRVKEALETLTAGLAPAEAAGDLQTLREIESFQRRCQRALGREPVETRDRRVAPGPRLDRSGESAEATAEARRVFREGFEDFANDRFEAAVEQFERALEVDPDLAIAWNGLSLAWRQRGDLEAAVRAGRRLVELEPEDPLSHTNLSILYQRMGMIPEAEEESAVAMQILMGQNRGGGA